jgi:serpin B
VAGNTALALDLYNAIASDRTSENIFISPGSITTAFGLLYPGARGQTEAELEQVLHIDLPMDEYTATLGELTRGLNVEGKGRRMAINNAVWADNGLVLQKGYFDTVKAAFAAKERRVDYRNDAEGARQEINRWVEEKTEDRIQDLIPKDVLDKTTRAVLVNTIYLDADWAQPFTKEATRDENFTLLGGEIVLTDMMNQTGDFRYAKSSAVEALKLPYVGGELSTVILLPKAPDGLADVEAKFLSNPRALTKLLADLDANLPVEVELKLPKLKLEDKFMLSEKLKELGMITPFSNAADFTGMALPEEQPDGRGVKISEVIHQTFLEVDEKGTEAAAATAIVMITTTSAPINPPPPPIPFHVDQPHIMLIQHEPSGMILFLGRITDPR